MLPGRVSNPGPLTYESGVLPIALRGPAAKSLTFSSALPTKVPLFQWPTIYAQNKTRSGSQTLHSK